MKTWHKRLWKGLKTLLVLAVLGQFVAIWSAFCVVRVSFTGLDNLFHVPYEYYALTPVGKVRVLSPFVLLACGTAPLKNNVYDDTSTGCWSANLMDSPTGEGIFTDLPSLPSSFGETVRLYYRPWTRHSGQPGQRELEAMSRWAEEAHRAAPEATAWMGDGNTGYVFFLFYSHGDRMLLADDRNLYQVRKDGSFQLLLTISKRGHLDYLCFPPDRDGMDEEW